MTDLDSVLKSRDITPYSQGYGLPSDLVLFWELDHKEGRMPKHWCLQTDAGEDAWKSLGEQGDQTSKS